MSRSETPAAVGPGRRRLGVVLVDPLPVVRAGLGLLIEGSGDLEVLAQAGDADAALQALSRIRRSRVVVLVGLALSGAHDAAWFMRTIRERYPSLAVLALGADADPTTISHALFVGADGFVDKNVAPEAFLDAIRRGADRGMVLVSPDGDAVGPIANELDRRKEMELLLTTRERQVLTVAAEGLTARQIAGRLGVRERTVTTHLGRIYGKLGVGTRLGAIRVAARSGLVTVGSPE
jgi:DNA-binding NarL/FixJ family response regulator